VGTYPKKQAISKSFELILKQNNKKLWESRSHAFTALPLSCLHYSESSKSIAFRCIIYFILTHFKAKQNS